MSLPKRFRSNQLVMVAYELLNKVNKRRIVIGMDSIKHRDSVPVEEFPPDRVVLERSGKWRVMVLVLERLAVLVRDVWGETAVEVFANWLSQIRYIGLYDWHAADADCIYGKVFDFSSSPIVHLGAFDERSIDHKEEETNRLNLDRMAGVPCTSCFMWPSPCIPA